MNFKNKKLIKQIVTEVINKHDPEQLLSVGAPTDEYDTEIAAITESLRPGFTHDQVWILICNTIHWYFGDHEQPVLYSNGYKYIADELWRRLPEVDVLVTDTETGAAEGKTRG